MGSAARSGPGLPIEAVYDAQGLDAEDLDAEVLDSEAALRAGGQFPWTRQD